MVIGGSVVPNGAAVVDGSVVVVGASVVTGLGVDGALTLRLLRRRLLSSQASPGEIKSASSAKASNAQIIFAMIVSLKKKNR